ncbi:hypothetical protein LTR28_009532 [Elasticomyces elasticus]|nr:hypothetical protein LTR28_009532 [Elasticomyces elasticus]
MEQFNRLFRQMPEYRIMVCKECRFAVPPGQIRTRLTEHHAGIPAKASREIADAVRESDSLAQVRKEVIYPEASAAVVEGLPVHNDGLSERKQRKKPIRSSNVARQRWIDGWTVSSSRRATTARHSGKEAPQTQ